MHFLLAAILFVLVYALLWRPWYTEWRLNRDIRRHLPPPGGWPAQRQPAPVKSVYQLAREEEQRQPARPSRRHNWLQEHSAGLGVATYCVVLLVIFFAIFH